MEEEKNAYSLVIFLSTDFVDDHYLDYEKRNKDIRIRFHICVQLANVIP